MGFSRRGTFTVTGSATLLPSTQTDFPVLVSITHDALKGTSSGGFVTDAQADDVVAYSDFALTSILNYELERYNGTTGELVMWVKITSLAISGVFYLGIGNAAITTFQGNINGTWNSAFKWVQHLPNGTALTAVDSTSGGFNGTLVNTPTAGAGQVDGAASFVRASSQYITNANAPVTTYPLTLSAWVKLSDTSFAGGEDRVIMAVCKKSGLDEFWMSYIESSGVIRLRMVAQAAGAPYIGYNVLTPNTSWHHIAAVFTDSSTFALYYDGSPLSLTFDNSPVTPSALSDVYIGGFLYNTSTFYGGFQGLIDEARISNVARSADWIKAEYSNHVDPSTFVASSLATTYVFWNEANRVTDPVRHQVLTY